MRIRSLLTRLSNARLPGRLDRELREEMEGHLAPAGSCAPPCTRWTPACRSNRCVRWRLVAPAAAAGLVAAWALSRFLAAFRFGVSATDAATYVLCPVLFILIALAAAYAPARRAAAVDPMASSAGAESGLRVGC